MRASRGGSMGPAEMALATLFGSIGFLAADGLDRFLATYDPSAADRPKDKFVSDGAGTLANVLNIGSRPGLVRLGAGVGAVAAPAIGASFIKNPMARAALEGMALGAGISLVKTLWSSFVMPMIVGTKPENTTPDKLQKSPIARMYPAEVSAAINMAAHEDASGATTPGPYAAAGVLSGPDVGPFALSGDSPYPDANQAIRRAAGVGGDSPYPDAGQAIRHAAGVSGDSPYPDAHSALRHAAGVSWQPGDASDVGPGPQTGDSCGCVGDDPGAKFSAFLGDGPSPQDPLVILPGG